MKSKYYLLLILFVAALISSLILSFPSDSVCEPGKGCDIVHSSEYSEFLGLNLSYYGVVIFAGMVILTLSYLKKPKKFKHLLINTGVFIGAMISLYLIYLQQFVIKAYCQYCLVVDFSMLLALLVIIIRKHRIR